MLFNTVYNSRAIGAGVFLTTVVVGAVCLVGPFHAMERPFLRDIVFYLATVCITFIIVWDRQITLIESLGKRLVPFVKCLKIIQPFLLSMYYFRSYLF